MSTPAFDKELMFREISDGNLGGGVITLDTLDIKQTPVRGNAIRLTFEENPGLVEATVKVSAGSGKRLPQQSEIYAVIKEITVTEDGGDFILPFSGQRANMTVELDVLVGGPLGPADIGVVLKAHDEFNRDSGSWG